MMVVMADAENSKPIIIHKPRVKAPTFDSAGSNNRAAKAPNIAVRIDTT